jgi:hypothetical protein
MFDGSIQRSSSRRDFLKASACGFGYLALADLCAEVQAAETTDPLAAKKPHFQVRAKRVIFLFMGGAPSHVDTFDYKPQLQADDGKTVDVKGRGRKLMKSPFQFTRHGQSGLWFPEIFPNLAKHADDLCLLNSMYTDVGVHPQAVIEMHTGTFRFQRPSMGAWTLYGLGTENTELPGFITIDPQGGSQSYGSSFLPASYQGTRIDGGGPRAGGGRIANIENPKLTAQLQRKQLDLLGSLNRERLEKDKINSDLEGLIESYELAFRMEGSVPAIMDIASESKMTQQAYGIGERGTNTFGLQCLLARRFAEAGVRFIEVSMGGWDQHNNRKRFSNDTLIAALRRPSIPGWSASSVVGHH